MGGGEKKTNLPPVKSNIDIPIKFGGELFFSLPPKTVALFDFQKGQKTRNRKQTEGKPEANLKLKGNRMSKQYYGVFYKEEGSIFRDWNQCQSFMKRNNGFKRMKGFITLAACKKWLSDFGDDEPMIMWGQNPKVKKNSNAKNLELAHECCSEITNLLELETEKYGFTTVFMALAKAQLKFTINQFSDFNKSPQCS